MSEQTIEDQAFASPRNLSKGMIARQPIVNGLQQIIGYELFNRSRSPYGHTMASDATLIFAALTHAGEEDLVGTKLMFVNCTHEGLTGEHLELLPADKVVLEIPPLGHAAVHEVAARLPTLLALKEQGFHLAFNHTVLESVYSAWLPLADYIKLDLSTLAPDQLTVLVKFANRHTRAELIAEKVESAHQHELGQRLGIELFQGFWFARPTVMQTRLLTPTQQSIIQLLTLRDAYKAGQANLDAGDLLIVGLQMSFLSEVEDVMRNVLWLDRFTIARGSGSAFNTHDEESSKDIDVYHVEMGKYITDKVMLKYTQQIGGDDTHRFGVQYDMNDRFGLSLEKESQKFIVGLEARVHF